MQPRTQYTREQKAEALGLLIAVGKAEAARQTGIPAGTISSWAVRNGVTTNHAAPEQLAGAAQSVAEQKQKLVDRLLPLAAKLVTKLEAKASTDDASLKELAQTLMIIVDKVQLLTGQATARTETTIAGVEVEAARARAATVLDELAAKRVA